MFELHHYILLTVNILIYLVGLYSLLWYSINVEKSLTVGDIIYFIGISWIVGATLILASIAIILRQFFNIKLFKTKIIWIIFY